MADKRGQATHDVGPSLLAIRCGLSAKVGFRTTKMGTGRGVPPSLSHKSTLLDPCRASSVIPDPDRGIHGGASSPFSRGFTREWRGRASLLRQAPPGHPGFVGLVLPEIWNATTLMKSYLSDKCKLSVSQSTQHVS